MRVARIVAAAAVLVATQAVGVVHAQYPGEVSPFGPSSSDAIANMKFTFQVCAPNAVVREAQVALKEQGYYDGPIDGVLSPAVKTALWSFQRANGMTPCASLDRLTVAALGLGGGAGYASPPTFEARERPPIDVQAP